MRSIGGITVVVALLALAVAAPAQADMSIVRKATAAYHSIDTASAAGYGARVTDVNGVACIDQPGAGGMGVHYANFGLVFDDAVNAATPELLVYEPQPNGRLRLVATEYAVFQEAWDASHGSPPSLFGQEFELIGSPNRYGLPPFYELHAWVWKHNPRGMFDDWNPRVSCDAA